MCGVFGYVGHENACEIVLSGLRALEYRGYDSAGIAVHRGAQKITVVKAAGKISGLEKKLAGSELAGEMAIGHTRWATHGEPSEANAHPHSDCTGRITLVHNGNIENFRELRARLVAEGHRFTSETDTEVLAHLIERSDSTDLVDAVRRALAQIEGTYGIAVMSASEPGRIVAARQSSSLMIGIGDGFRIIASDVTPVLRSTRNVIYLEDGDIAVLSANNHLVSDRAAERITRPATTVEWNVEQASKGGFLHYMLKEIMEQPQALKDSLRGRMIPEDGVVRLGGLTDFRERLRKMSSLTIVGCGTAYHAGLVGKKLIQTHAGIPVDVELASEYTNSEDVPRGLRHAVLAISQSGETLDTRLAIQLAKQRGHLALGLVNRVGSEIVRITDAGIYNHVGPEIAVASTKAFLSEIAILTLFAVHLGRTRNLEEESARVLLTELRGLPDQIGKILEQRESIREIAERYAGSKNFLYLGRGWHYPIALEGALKLKEVTYIHAEACAAGEMKHGTLALIDSDFPTFVIALSGPVLSKMLGSIGEIKARKGPIVALVDCDSREAVREVADAMIEVPRTSEAFSPILAGVAIQLFAYYTGVALGRDVDRPRNIAKSVTTE